MVSPSDCSFGIDGLLPIDYAPLARVPLPRAQLAHPARVPPAQGPGEGGAGPARRGARGDRPHCHGPPPPPWGPGGRGWIGVGTQQDTMQSPKTLYKAPTDNTKPRHIIQSPEKTTQSFTKTIQRLKILEEDIKY